jgi:diguanylate cyclase (GGDEF)-like protein
MPGVYPGVAWALIGVVIVYGVACVRCWIPWERYSLRHHAAAVIGFQPLIAVGLWVSGGVDSYLGPILVLPTLYVAYFFPPRLAWPLAVIEITTYFTPVLYSESSDTHLLVGRTVMYAAAYGGLVATIQYLKSHLVAAEQRQRRMAHTDPLTALPNRRAFDLALDSAVAAGRPFSLLLIDIDRFKQINDTRGHLAGDSVLRQVGEILRREARSVDIVARYGGEEFVVVMPETGLQGATIFAERLRQRIEKHDFADTGDQPLNLTVSIGLAAFPDDKVQSAEGFVAVADQALYRAKNEGRNLVRP